MPRVRETKATGVEKLRAEYKRNLDACVRRGLKLEDAKHKIQTEAREICDGEDCTPAMWVEASRRVLGETYADRELGY